MCDLQNLNAENGAHHLIMARYTVNQHAPKILDNGSPPVIQTGWGGIVGVGRTIFRKMIQINAKCKLCGFIPMTMTMCRRVWRTAYSVAWETSKKTAISAKQYFYSCPPTPRLRWTLLRDNCSACVACHSDRVADAKCGRGAREKRECAENKKNNKSILAGG